MTALGWILRPNWTVCCLWNQCARLMVSMFLKNKHGKHVLSHVTLLHLGARTMRFGEKVLQPKACTRRGASQNANAILAMHVTSFPVEVHPLPGSNRVGKKKKKKKRKCRLSPAVWTWKENDPEQQWPTDAVCPPQHAGLPNWAKLDIAAVAAQPEMNETPPTLRHTHQKSTVILEIFASDQFSYCT